MRLRRKDRLIRCRNSGRVLRTDWAPRYRGETSSPIFCGASTLQGQRFSVFIAVQEEECFSLVCLNRSFLASHLHSFKMKFSLFPFQFLMLFSGFMKWYPRWLYNKFLFSPMIAFSVWNPNRWVYVTNTGLFYNNSFLSWNKYLKFNFFSVSIFFP